MRISNDKNSYRVGIVIKETDDAMTIECGMCLHRFQSTPDKVGQAESCPRCAAEIYHAPWYNDAYRRYPELYPNGNGV